MQVPKLVRVALLSFIAAAAQAQAPQGAPQGAPPGGAPGPGALAPPPGGPGAGGQFVGGAPPPLPKGGDLPEYRAGGGRTISPVAMEQDVMRHLMPPLPSGTKGPSPDLKDFGGAWDHNQVMIARIEWDRDGNEVPFTATGRALRDRRVKSAYKDGQPNVNASAECLPPGQPWLFGMYYPFQIFQNKNKVVFLFQYIHAAWNIRLNGTHNPATPGSYMGDSIGHWEGNTLVVDTINYKGPFWIDTDGTPATKNTHMIFRISRINPGDPQLEIVTTIADPKMYTRPWSIVRTFAWRPDKIPLEEYNCEEQVGGKPIGEQYGLSKEKGSGQ